MTREEFLDYVIEENKDDTAWFNDELYFVDMYRMLRDSMNFGKAETMVILASLMKAGAKFKVKGEEE